MVCGRSSANAKVIRTMLARLFHLVLGALLLASVGLAKAESTQIQLASADTHRLFPSADVLLAKTFEEIRASRLDGALKKIDQLISIRPDFKLAHLIRGDLLMARSQPLATLGAVPKAPADSLSDLREEARVRMLRYVDEPPAGSLPKQILQLDSRQQYALLADAGRARLYVFENVAGTPRLVRDYYITIGRNGINKQVEGDKKTPVGVYTISQHLPRQQLTDFYGSGAFPLDYPNDWDRLQGRGGHGIWLHGTPSNTYSRPPRSSDGCIVVANPDLDELAKYVQVGTTPVMIADRTEWVDPLTWEASRQEVLSMLEQWRNDWQNRETERFLGYYTPSFLDSEPGWAEGKMRNIDNKTWIKVNLSDVSVFLYPDTQLAVTTFQQDYASDRFTNSIRKRLYWRLEGGRWRIALEQSLPASTQVAARGR